MHIATFVWDG